MITWVLFLGIGLVVGIVAGLYFARLDDVSNRQKNALQQKLYDTEQQLKNYESQVTEHFLKTASLVNSMTESYKAVHEHLSQGARQLCDSQVTVAQLEMPATKLLDSTKKADTPMADRRTETAAPSSESPAKQSHRREEESTEHPELAETETAESRVSAKDPLSGKADQPEATVAKAAQAEKPQTQAEAIQPPSTPESLHVDESEGESNKSLKESETTSPANVSRMVH